MVPRRSRAPERHGTGEERPPGRGGRKGTAARRRDLDAALEAKRGKHWQHDPTGLRELGRRLHRARVERSLSRGRAAAYAEMSSEHLRSIESGTVNLSLRKLLAICYVLDLDAESLIRELQKGTRGRSAASGKRSGRIEK